MASYDGGPSARGVLSEGLSNDQRAALDALKMRNAGCIFIEGDFVWPVDIREDPAKARAVLAEAGAIPMAVTALSGESEEYPLCNPDEAPRSQLDFVGWVQANHKRVFGQDVYPTGAKPIKAPKVASLAVYAAEAYGGKYMGAWSAYDGRFVGWMWYSPAMTPIDHTYAVGKVDNKPVFGDMTAHCIRRSPVKVFTDALKTAIELMKVV